MKRLIALLGLLALPVLAADVKISALPAVTDSSDLLIPANQAGVTSAVTTGVANGIPYIDAAGHIQPTSGFPAGVTGTGAAGQVTYWSGTSAITGNSNFLYDAAGHWSMGPYGPLGTGLTVSGASGYIAFDMDTSDHPIIYMSGTNSDNAATIYMGNANDVYLNRNDAVPEGSNLHLGVNGSDALVLHSGISNFIGNVGIGTTTPTQSLDISGNEQIDNSNALLIVRTPDNTGATINLFGGNSSVTNQILFGTAGGSGWISAAGNSGLVLSGSPGTPMLTLNSNNSQANFTGAFSGTIDVGINTTTPTQALDVVGNTIITGQTAFGSTAAIGAQNYWDFETTETSAFGSSYYRGMNVETTFTPTTNTTSGLSNFVSSNNLTGAFDIAAANGSVHNIENSSTGTVTLATAGFSEVDNNSSGVITTAIGTQGGVNNEGTGNVDLAYGVNGIIGSTGANQVVASAALHAASPVILGGGVIPLNYGVLIEDQTGPATSWAIYSKAPQPSFLSGILYATGGLDTVDTPATVNLYVNASTGSDSNPCTIASPCLTLQHTINQVTLMTPGIYQINVADGTYAENIIEKDIIGPAGDATYGNSVIKIIGDTAVPANVIIRGAGGNTITGRFVNAVYVFDGVQIENDGTTTTSHGFDLIRSAVSLRDINFNAVGIGIYASRDDLVTIEQTAAGGNWDVLSGAAISGCGSQLIVNQPPVVTGTTGTGFIAAGALIDFTGVSSVSITSGVGGMNNAVVAEGGCNAVGAVHLGSSQSWTISGANKTSESQGFLALIGGQFTQGVTNTYNFDHTNRPFEIDDFGQWLNNTGSSHTYNYGIATTAAAWVTASGQAFVETNDNFGGVPFVNALAENKVSFILPTSLAVASASSLTVPQGSNVEISGTTAIDFIATQGRGAGSILHLTLTGPAIVDNMTSSPPSGFSPIHIINGSNFISTIQRANITLKLSNDTTTWDEIAGEDGSQPLAQGSISAGPNIQITGTGSNPIIDAAPNNIDLTATGIPFTVPDTNNANIFADTTAGAIAINQPATPLAGQEIVITNVGGFGTGNVSYTANTPPDVFTIPIGTSQTFRYYDTATQWRPVALNGDLSFIANANATAANVPMNGFGFTGMASGVNPQDAVTVSQLPVDPAASSVVAITAGTAFQNTSGGDLIISGTIVVTVAISGTVQIGVGPTSTPTTNDITPSLTAPGNVAFSVRVPNNSYVLITATGTASITSITAISS